MTAPWPDGDPRWYDESATVRFGPGPPPPAVVRPPDVPRAWRRLAPPVAVLAVATVLILLLRASPVTDDPDGRGPADRATPMTSTSLTGEPITQLGDPAIAELADGRRFALGEPGDWLLVGDWDCDGDDSPALYRPSTGDAFVFERWATDRTLESRQTRHTGVIDGRPRRITIDGCDDLAVDPAPARPVHPASSNPAG